MKKYLIIMMALQWSAILAGQEFDICNKLDWIIGREIKNHERKFNLKSTPETEDYDLVYCRFTWEVDPAHHYISGSVVSCFTPVEKNFNRIHFLLKDNMTINKISYHDSTLSYTRSNDLIAVELPAVVPIRELDSIGIEYEGAPETVGLGSFITDWHNESPILWTLSEPDNAYSWWPCKNGLGDKIDSADIIIITPEQYKAGSNGMLVSEKADSGYKAYHWKHRYPIEPYLVSIAVTDYAEITDYVPLDNGDSVLIQSYVFQENLSNARLELKKTSRIMQLYNDLVGTYPFAEEKYGHAQISDVGAMEHQTMSSMGKFSWDYISHELAHQWFGNKVTCGSWEDVWMNEGFATYLEGLNYEFLTPDPYDWDIWKLEMIDRITSVEDGSVRVDDVSDIRRIFDGRLTYRKGAMLLNMLRWMLGDENFFQGIRNYLNDPDLAYGYAVTDDLKHHLELAGGIDLTEFFKDWYYGQGYPSYGINITPKPGGANIIVHQNTSHSSVDFYEMPLPVKFSDGINDTIVRVDHTFSGQFFDIDLPFVPDYAEFDPHHQIISKNNQVTVLPFTANPDVIGSGIRIYPNPAINRIRVELNSPGHCDRIRSLVITDITGAVIHMTDEIRAITVLDMSDYPAGTYLLTFLTNNGSFVRTVIKQ